MEILRKWKNQEKNNGTHKNSNLNEEFWNFKVSELTNDLYFAFGTSSVASKCDGNIFQRERI